MRVQGLLGVLVLLALILLPSFLPIYFVLLFTEILIMGLFALSFNLLFGYTGLLSFGHAAFFGLGGYAAAFLIRDWGASMALAMLAGVIVAGAAAVLIGYLSVRLDEIYFAMLTLGFGMMFFTLVHQWREVTGGSDGITGFGSPTLKLFGLTLSLGHPVHYYYFALAVVAGSSYLLWRITRSPFGLLLLSLRENPERAAFLGVDVRRYRWFAFVIAGIFAGLAGSLFSPFDRMASPTMLHWTKSAEPVLMSILGGANLFLGPMVGAAIFFFLEHIITKFTTSWMIFLGAILVLLVIFFPEGILGTVVRRGHGKG